MRSKFPALVLTIPLVVNIPHETHAEKLRPLAEITPIGGVKIYFDPERVSAIYNDVLVSVTDQTDRTGHPEIHVHPGPVKTHVFGISNAPIPIDSDARTFLGNLNLLSKFIVLHSTGGELYLKATAVVTITPPIGKYDPRIKAFIFPGPSGYGGVRAPFQVFEDPENVRGLVDEKRAQQDAAE